MGWVPSPKNMFGEVYPIPEQFARPFQMGSTNENWSCCQTSRCEREQVPHCWHLPSRGQQLCSVTPQGKEWMLTCLGIWRDIRAAASRALIAGWLIWHSRATPLPRTTRHPTTSSQVSSLPCLLVAERGDAELLHL